jgi:hypothetical protein
MTGKDDVDRDNAGDVTGDTTGDTTSSGDINDETVTTNPTANADENGTTISNIATTGAVNENPGTAVSVLEIGAIATAGLVAVGMAVSGRKKL